MYNIIDICIIYLRSVCITVAIPFLRSLRSVYCVYTSLALGTVWVFSNAIYSIILAAFYESDHQQVIIGKMHG